MKLCVDLCSGLGGFSSAFRDSPDWEVITVDIERRFKPTICADVMTLPLREDFKADVGLASPPCDKMSIASVSHHWTDKKPNPATMPTIRLFHHVRDWLEAHCEKHLRENPMGMARNESVYGKPMMTLNLSDYGTKWKKRTDFWGNIMLPMIDGRRDWEPAPRGSNGGVQGVRDPAKRALLPYALSRAIFEAVSK